MPPFKEPGDRKGRPYISQYPTYIRDLNIPHVSGTGRPQGSPLHFVVLDAFEESGVVCEEVADVVDAVLL